MSSMGAQEMALKGEVGVVVREEKSSGVNMSLTVQFQEAVKRDEIPKARDLLIRNPETAAWTANPLLIAYQHGRLHFAMEIARGMPDLTTIANQDGDIAMHFACARGDVEMVEFLEKLNPRSCLVENTRSMTPLHVAGVKGHSVVISKLVSLCPDSLQKIMKLSLHESSSSHIEMQVNTENELGSTALDLCRANSPDTVSQEISPILQEAADNERCFLEPQPLSRVPNRALTVKMRNVLLVVLVMIAAAAFTVTCNLPDTLLREIYRSGLISSATASDVISGRLPTVVYLMVFNSAGFMTSMAAISCLIWPLPLRSTLLFVLVCTCIVYIILVGKITPKFSIRVGNLSFSSITLVWSSVLAFIVFGITTISVGKYALHSITINKNRRPY